MLTQKQHQFLTYLTARLAGDRHPPSYEEICRDLGLRSKSGVHRIVSSLVERGFVAREGGRARALVLLRPATEWAESARRPGARPTPDPRRMPRAPREPLHPFDVTLGDDAFVHAVGDDSMSEAGIMPGDVAVIARRRTTSDGEIAAVKVAGRPATLRRLRRLEDGDVLLEAANPRYESEVMSPLRVAIEGRLIGVMRRYAA